MSAHRLLLAAGIGAAAVTLAVAARHPQRDPVRAVSAQAPTTTVTAAGTVPAATAAAPPPTGPGPTRTVSGVPMGYRHDPSGALAAASAFVAEGPVLVSVDEPAALAAERTMASSGSADAMVARARQQLDNLHRLPPGSFSYRIAALADRVMVHSPDRVTVELWCVQAVLADGRPGYADYRTVGFDLVWEAGDWHQAGGTDVPGPRLALGADSQPTPAAEAAAALAGFGPVGVPGFDDQGANHG
jgi:hypothetical protein